MLTTNDTETSEEAYLDVIRAKTATLFAAAATGRRRGWRAGLSTSLWSADHVVV